MAHDRSVMIAVMMLIVTVLCDFDMYVDHNGSLHIGSSRTEASRVYVQGIDVVAELETMRKEHDHLTETLIEIHKRSSVVWRRSWSTGESTKLTADDAAINDYFGQSVALDGDILAVGAITDDTTGSVYIMQMHAPNDFRLLYKLFASDGAMDDSFGISVSVCKNVLAVGAYAANTSNGVNSGGVYIFEKNPGGIFVEKHKIVASDGEPDNYFGASVYVDEQSLIVGAWCGRSSSERPGCVYIFEKQPDGEYKEKYKIYASDSEGDAIFGCSVSLDGDVLAIGAYGDGTNGGASGAVYIFAKNGSGIFEETSKLYATDGKTGQWFGRSVALDGNILIVGATNDDMAHAGAGSIYIFQRQGSGLHFKEDHKMTASDVKESSRFGIGVTVEEGIMVVGAYGDSDAGQSAGAVYIFNARWESEFE